MDVTYLGYETSPTMGSFSLEGANVTENFLHESVLRGHGKWVLKRIQTLQGDFYYTLVDSNCECKCKSRLHK